MNGTISILLAAKSAFVLSALFYLPGLAWVWLLPARSRTELYGTALTIGLPIILLPAILLAELGHFTNTYMWLWTAITIAAGLVTGWFTNKNHCIPCFRNGFTGFYILIAALFICLALPDRGEWLAGGWDPGVNTNQGLLVARTGSVAQPPDALRAQALQEAPDSFARQQGAFTEVFPGIPADPETGAITPYFYRATPTLIAIGDLVGSRTAALRINHLSALFALFLFAALLAAADLPRSALLLGTATLALQPILIAHTANPASEMLGLAIICAVGLLLLREEERATPLLALLLLLATLNRASFLFYQSFLLLILTVWDANQPDRRRITARHTAIAVALLISLAWYKWVAPDSIYKIRHLYPLLAKLSIASLCAFVAMDGTLLLLRRALPRRTRLLALLFPLALLVREFTLREPWSELPGNLSAWFAYATPTIAILALIGLLWQFHKTPLAPWLLWLFTALLTVLLHRHAANLYPWATKRWLVYSPPLLAAGIGCLAVGPKFLPSAMRKITLALIAVGLILALPLARAAWRSAEYNGLDRTLAALAASLDENAVIVTDHFLWGTPLALAYGHTVLDAEPLLAGHGDAEAAARVLAASGKQIVLVNSTDDGLTRWPDIFKTSELLTLPLDFDSQTVIQHRSHRMFDKRDISFTFQTYLWHPSL